MSTDCAPYDLQGKELEDHLLEIFDGDRVITKSKFLKVFKIGPTALKDMIAYGRAPKMIPLGMGSGEGRYFLTEIARWVEQSRTMAPLPKVYPDGTPRRGRGRPRKDAAA